MTWACPHTQALKATLQHALTLGRKQRPSIDMDSPADKAIKILDRIVLGEQVSAPFRHYGQANMSQCRVVCWRACADVRAYCVTWHGTHP